MQPGKKPSLDLNGTQQNDIAMESDYSDEGQDFNWQKSVKYSDCDVDAVFNAIQFPIFLIDIRAEAEYQRMHIRQAFHIEAMKRISASGRRLFFKNERIMPIYIYAEDAFDDKLHTETLRSCVALLIRNEWIHDANNIELNIFRDGFGAFFKQYGFECTSKASPIPYQYSGSLYPNVVFRNALFYGNAEHAISGKVMMDLGITHILNITNQDFQIKWKQDEEEEEKKMEHLKLPIHDNEDNQISVHFETANKFLDESLADGRRVLVHCMMGSSRSGTILVQYLMHKHKLSLFEAYQKIYNCRPCLWPNESFMDELEKNEVKLFKQSTRKQVEESAMRQ